MRVVVFSAFFPPAFLGGGALKSVAAIVSQAPEPFDTTVICSDTDLGGSTPLPVPRNVPTRWEGAMVLYTTASSVLHVLRSLRYARDVQPEFVYVNSFFDAKFSILPLILWRLKWFRSARFVIAPRGEFGEAALSLSKAKKSLFLHLSKGMYDAKGLIWHASSLIEAENIRATVGDKAQVVVQEDNTDLPAEPIAPEIGEVNLRAAVLGRIVPVKGIEELLLSLGRTADRLTLDIFGPEEDAEYARRCHSIAESLPPNITVNFKGILSSSLVRQTLSGYDVLLHPTHGENFSHVIAESLSASLPVMCADVTPWTPRLRAGGGVVVSDNSTGAWAAAVSHYARLSPSDRLKKREDAGRTYKLWRSSLDGQHVFELLGTSAS